MKQASLHTGDKRNEKNNPGIKTKTGIRVRVAIAQWMETHAHSEAWNTMVNSLSILVRELPIQHYLPIL